MHYEDRVVAFIDILGFAQHISKTLDVVGNEKPDMTANLTRALSLIRDYAQIDEERLPDTRMATQFSDSIVLSFRYQEPSEVFRMSLFVLHLATGLTRYGFLVRGGIAYGKLFHTREFIFGPALVEAHRLESKKAIYPRVIMTKQIVQIGTEYRVKHHDEDTEREYLNEILLEDKDDFYYVDYFTGAHTELSDEDEVLDYIENLRRIILSIPYKTDPKLEEKYNWLKEKFNEMLMRKKEAFANTDRTKSIDINPALFDIYRTSKLIT